MNLASASVSPGLTSGWYLRARFQYAFFISALVGVAVYSQNLVIVTGVKSTTPPHSADLYQSSRVSSSDSCSAM